MSDKRRTEITVETHKVTIIRRRSRISREWCNVCADEVQMLSTEQAAAFAGLSTRAICRGVEAGQLHFHETGDGRLFICVNSLTTNTNKEE